MRTTCNIYGHDITIARQGFCQCPPLKPGEETKNSGGRVSSSSPKLSTETVDEVMLAYKRAAYSAMLTPNNCGGACAPGTDAYGYYQGVSYDDTETLLLCCAILEHGVDASASSDPAQHIGTGFGGTDAGDDKTPYLLGTLITGDGSEWTVVSSLEEDSPLGSFGTALKMINDSPSLTESASGKIREMCRSHGHYAWTSQANLLPKNRKTKNWFDEWEEPIHTEIDEAVRTIKATGTRYLNNGFGRYIKARQNDETHEASLAIVRSGGPDY